MTDMKRAAVRQNVVGNIGLGMQTEGDREGSMNTNQPTARNGREGQRGRQVQGLDEEEIRDGLVRTRRRCPSCERREEWRQTPSDKVEWIQLRGTGHRQEKSQRTE